MRSIQESKNPVFCARSLTKTYQVGDLRVEALRGVDIEFYESEFIVLLGPSGSGKSTLLNILGGLDSATSGSVFYRDHNLVQASEDELTVYRRDHVGFVFQFYNLIPSLTAEENVALVTEIARNPMSPREALALVGLEDRARHFPSQLSGGEQQRVAIARAVSKRPEILLCDEPTGALDLETGRKVLEAVRRANEELGTLVAVITHNAAIAGIAHRTLSLADGRISKVEENPKRISVSEVRW
jgi:putative ABC transport system ATP-binding protein